jgi:hypothetical protein
MQRNITIAKALAAEVSLFIKAIRRGTDILAPKISSIIPSNLRTVPIF